MKTKLVEKKRRVRLETQGMRKVVDIHIPYFDECPEIIIRDNVIYKATTSYSPTTYRECLLVYDAGQHNPFEQDVLPDDDDDDTDTVPPDPNTKPLGQEY